MHAAAADTASLGDIYYSFSENASLNTANGSFQIEAEDYELFLRRGFSMTGPDDKRLTAIEAAEIMWSELLEQADVCS